MTAQSENFVIARLSRQQPVVLTGRIKSRPRQGNPDSRGRPTAWARFAAHQEGRETAQWAIDTETRLTAEVREQTEELAKAVAALQETEQELRARTEWAMQLDEEKRRLEEQLTLVRASRWVKLGRKVGVGPAL